MTASVIVAVVAAVFAGLSAGVSVLTYRRAGRDRIQDAEARAKEHEEHKRELAEQRDLLRRRVATAEAAEQREQEQATQPAVDWQVEYHDGPMWYLRNIGQYPAGNVEVTGIGGSESNLVVIDRSQFVEVEPWAVIELMLTEDGSGGPPAALHIVCDGFPEGWTKPVRRWGNR